MGILDILKISASALKAERTRMEITSSNLANIHTTR
ncbi:MAG: flagellar basal body protein, partial [Syntrophorhabdus sp.]